MTSYFPPNAARILRELCINPFEPNRISHEKGSYVGHYELVGALENITQTERLQTDAGCWLYICTHVLPYGASEADWLDEFKTGPRLFVGYSIKLPWLLTSHEERELGCAERFKK